MKKIFLHIILMVITATVYCQNVYVVTKTTDPNPFEHKFDNIDSLCDPEIYGTLQWAINKVNSNSGDSRIEFNIPGVGPHEIILNYYLPQIKNATIIDGSTQNGYSYGNPQIIINAQHKHNSIFDVYSTNITIKGLKLTSFAQNGILLHDCSNSLVFENIIYNYSTTSSKTSYSGLFINGCQNVEVYGNNIEVALDETVDPVTKSYGIYLSKSVNCTIGGTDVSMTNTIKNCRNYGVFSRSSQQIKFSGNIIFDCEKAIYLDASNDNIQPPIISEYTNGILSGTALPNSTIEVFGSIGAENANEYLESVIADENGDWGVFIETSNSYYITTQTDINSNSSSLSNSFLISQNINCSLDCPVNPVPNYYYHENGCNLICNSNMVCSPGNECGFERTPPGWCSSHGTANGMHWNNAPTFLPIQDQNHGYITFSGCGGGDPFDPEDPTALSCPYLRGEGVMTKFLSDLVPNQRYKLSFYRAHKWSVEDFYIKFIKTESVGLPDGLDNWTLPVIEEEEGICETLYHEQPDFPNNFVWTYTEIDFVASSPYNGLWLYCEVNTPHHYGITFINGVKLIPILDDTNEIVFGPACVNEGSPLQLSVLNQDAISFNWSGPNNFQSDMANPIVSTSADETMAGIYYVTVTFAHDCIYTAELEVPISNIKVNIKQRGSNSSGFQNIVNNEISFCPYEKKYLRAVPNPYPAYSEQHHYEWNTGFIENTNHSTINITGEPPFTYSVTVTDKNGCVATDYVTANHYPVPESPLPFNTGPYCTGENIMLSVSNPNPDYAYSWSCELWTYNPSYFYLESHEAIRPNALNNFCCESNPDNMFNYSGNYIATVSNGLCKASATTYVDVIPDQTCLIAETNCPLCIGDVLTILLYSNNHPSNASCLLAESEIIIEGPKGIYDYEITYDYELITGTIHIYDLTFSDAGTFTITINSPNNCSSIVR
ncbi:MAG TPA: right-handed parallel beta-helix repeat-containing protein, partial [Bacteroidales bacterium]|nr:right-handed parallel beta-helix repeat-containing protein [Bacteroidales bacterium]